ncbi:PsbP-related protein [Methanobacterium oryzae]|uniref:PsbP-related protein n=1 Tax=Methanobacterium oryzae TaxID=69540 RepID=UPI003D1C146A
MKKYAILVMAVLAVVVFASGCIDDNTNSTSSQSTQPSIPTKLFSTSGVSFNYPESWEQYSADQLTFDIEGNAKVVGGVGTSNGDVLASVQQIPTQGYSLDEFENSMEQLIKQSGTLISTQSITTNGRTGFEIVYTLSSGKKERINGYTDGTSFYLLTMSTSESNYDSQQENFDVISQSFKIQ